MAEENKKTYACPDCGKESSNKETCCGKEMEEKCSCGCGHLKSRCNCGADCC